MTCRDDVKPMDFDILKECCAELGIELVPAVSSEFITLTDKQGNKVRIMIGDNIFGYEESK